jgi:hypothetical protein
MQDINPTLIMPDLKTQLEAIVHAVSLAEDNWRLDDRIRLATRLTRG